VIGASTATKSQITVSPSLVIKPDWEKEMVLEFQVVCTISRHFTGVERYWNGTTHCKAQQISTFCFGK
jgi:hypothetical protein